MEMGTLPRKQTGEEHLLYCFFVLLCFIYRDSLSNCSKGYPLPRPTPQHTQCYLKLLLNQIQEDFSVTPFLLRGNCSQQILKKLKTHQVFFSSAGSGQKHHHIQFRPEVLHLLIPPYSYFPSLASQLYPRSLP